MLYENAGAGGDGMLVLSPARKRGSTTKLPGGGRKDRRGKYDADNPIDDFLIHGLKRGYVQRFDQPATPVNNDYDRPKRRRGGKY